MGLQEALGVGRHGALELPLDDLLGAGLLIDRI